MRKRVQRHSKFENLTDEVIQQRWLALRPKMLKGLGISALVLISSYLWLHFGYPVHAPGQPLNVQAFSLEYFLTIAFQISLVLTACLVLLAGMSLYYGRIPARKTVTR